MQPIHDVDTLEGELSRPTAAALDTLRRIDGDILVLGAGGKMGPTLARMARRGLDEIGATQRKVIAVSRFSSAAAAAGLEAHGVETVSCDLLDRAAVARLPAAANVIFMAGHKFGTADAPDLTWAMNTLVPAHAADRYRDARTVVFSTACVYPLAAVGSRGAHEDDPLGPPGDYANSCVGRERIYSFLARRHGTPANACRTAIGRPNLKAIRRRQLDVMLPLRGRIFWRLMRLVPKWFMTVVARIVRKPQ